MQTVPLRDILGDAVPIGGQLELTGGPSKPKSTRLWHKPGRRSIPRNLLRYVLFDQLCPPVPTLCAPSSVALFAARVHAINVKNSKAISSQGARTRTSNTSYDCDDRVTSGMQTWLERHTISILRFVNGPGLLPAC